MLLIVGVLVVALAIWVMILAGEGLFGYLSAALLALAFS